MNSFFVSFLPGTGMSFHGHFDHRRDIYTENGISSVEEIKNILLLGSLYFNDVKKNILTTKSKNNRRTNSHGH